MKKVNCDGVKFISFEPLFDYVIADLRDIQWAIIGARTIWSADIGVNLEQTRNFAIYLMTQLRRDNVPIFLKPNLKYPQHLREMPKSFNEWKDKYKGESKEQNLF